MVQGVFLTDPPDFQYQNEKKLVQPMRSFFHIEISYSMEHDFFISLHELKETGHLSGCAQHFHRGTWNGVKLCHWR